MLHLILTASSDDTRVSVHWTLREILEDGSETTLKVRGEAFPLLEVGLFGEEPVALLDAALSALYSFRKEFVSTDQ